ncbi:hypothetical protein CAter282_3327 [Collimonas arenae]|uniref:DUF3563 domain-containing protein n=1 Tax=Collimonas arenae TaxID=279058 RepID=A0A127PTG7_9BURK|nr:DUF3563 family protein [Collimonas arenae]AMP01128.1 hypothetical protein CAter10_3647 [Collimonas arenae]AMP11022.1 hypothetical protein CAter282_3327 [Collimonas arenae]
MSTLTINSSNSISRPAASSTSVFSAVAAFFKRVGNAYERSEAERKEAYLAEAVDLYDLEYRMQQLDRESAQTAAWLKGF